MAKALLGHISTVDGRSVALAAEVRRLRSRVTELETQLEQAISANQQLHLSLQTSEHRALDTDFAAELLQLDEPAYT